MGVRSRERRARKARRCDGCGSLVRAGEVYVEHAMAPSRSLGNTTWLLKTECRACAGRLGRLSDSAPEEFMTPLFDAEAIA